METYRNMLKHMFPYGNIWKHWKHIRNILETWAGNMIFYSLWLETYQKHIRNILETWSGNIAFYFSCTGILFQSNQKQFLIKVEIHTVKMVKSVYIWINDCKVKLSNLCFFSNKLFVCKINFNIINFQQIFEDI